MGKSDTTTKIPLNQDNIDIVKNIIEDIIIKVENWNNSENKDAEDDPEEVHETENADMYKNVFIHNNWMGFGTLKSGYKNSDKIFSHESFRARNALINHIENRTN